MTPPTPRNDELPTSRTQGHCVGAPSASSVPAPPRPCSSPTVDSPGEVPTLPADPLPPHTHTPPRSRTLALRTPKGCVHSAGPRLSSQTRPRPHALWRSEQGLQPPPSPPGPGRPASQSRRPQGIASGSRPWTSSDSSAPPQPGKSPPPGLTDFPHGQSKRTRGWGVATAIGPSPSALPLR